MKRLTRVFAQSALRLLPLSALSLRPGRDKLVDESGHGSDILRSGAPGGLDRLSRRGVHVGRSRLQSRLRLSPAGSVIDGFEHQIDLTCASGILEKMFEEVLVEQANRLRDVIADVCQHRLYTGTIGGCQLDQFVGYGRTAGIHDLTRG